MNSLDHCPAPPSQVNRLTQPGSAGSASREGAEGDVLQTPAFGRPLSQAAPIGDCFKPTETLSVSGIRGAPVIVHARHTCTDRDHEVMR